MSIPTPAIDNNKRTYTIPSLNTHSVYVVDIRIEQWGAVDSRLIASDCVYAINYDNGSYHMNISVKVSLTTHTVTVEFENSNFPASMYAFLSSMKKVLTFNE